MTTDNQGDLEAVFQEGVDARAQHKTLAENPYPLRAAEHREWAAGWAATCDLDEEDDPESTRVKAGDLDTDEKPPRDATQVRKGPVSG